MLILLPTQPVTWHSLLSLMNTTLPMHPSCTFRLQTRRNQIVETPDHGLQPLIEVSQRARDITCPYAVTAVDTRLHKFQAGLAAKRPYVRRVFGLQVAHDLALPAARSFDSYGFTLFGV